MRTAFRAVISAALALTVVSTGISAYGATSPARRSAPAAHLRVRDVSGRPRMATGGDVLLAIDGVSDPSSVRVRLDGHTATVHTGVRDGTVLALVTGMKAGRHRIEVRAGDARASVAVRDFPITGPVFSGPHLPLPVCTTQDQGLGPPTDKDCSAPTKVTWKYRTLAGSFKPLADPAQRPPDLATVPGQPFPYVVREEEGVINRAVYWIAALDPEGAPSPFADDPGWNGRLVYRYGGGCGTSYSQGAPLATGVLDDGLLSRGYAVATATFNTFQVQCNDVLSAETTMMVKEHFAKTYGPPRFTIGDGGSGGAIQQILIAQNYPGLLDAIAPTLPFPDAVSIAPGVTDCGLLHHYYDTRGSDWTEAQTAAVDGHLTSGTCALWIRSFLSTIDPTTGCDATIPTDKIYSAANKKGLRCTFSDENRNELGVDKKTGFARRPLDNVGVQYGLQALNGGVIGVDQFLDLNEQVGGYDIDGKFMPRREVGRKADIEHLFATGRIDEGGGDLRRIPVITTNIYTDPMGDIHTRVWSFTIRERLRARDGTRDPNHVIWTRGTGGRSLVQNLTGAVTNTADLTRVLDEWLTTGTRPAAAPDNCVAAAGEAISGDHVYDPGGPCAALYPVHGDPRMAAGGPLRGDVAKCHLKKVDVADYKVPFTPDQQTRLHKMFPGGVCDWSKPSVGKVPLRGTWIDYGR